MGLRRCKKGHLLGYDADGTPSHQCDVCKALQQEYPALGALFDG